MKTCSKIWADIPFAHRAPLHAGHCRFIHGHNWTIEAQFIALGTDENGFVMDFGKLKSFKSFLETEFDHALVIAENDPLLPMLKEFSTAHGIQNIKVVPDCSCEGLAQFFFKALTAVVTAETSGRVAVKSVLLREDLKNSATYSLP